MKKLEIFPRKYDHFFTDTERWIRKCNPYMISVAAPYNKRIEDEDLKKLGEYQKDFIEAMTEDGKLVEEILNSK